MVKKIFIDIAKCIGCHACEIACEETHGKSYISVYEVTDFLTIPLKCMHCEKAPCIRVCPTRAMRRADGIVVVDDARCIGCTSCISVCPFGAPELNMKGIIEKCDQCRMRTMKGLLPACVAVCPTGALVFMEEEEFTKLRRLNVVKELSEKLVAYQ
ncbi:MAG: 4Fe-4S dicluster domain-containing protein [Ignisphaera sp.]|uniref:4Fe-4S dicluster domain-containing protein n=1 Tax=Ignisphaera aggregans TaxID=334771 RepID=A0A7J3I6A8_9CREN